MLRRTFLKAIGAAVAVACFPISLINKVKARERLPVGYCPSCYSYDIEVEDGKMFCHACEAVAECRVIMTIEKWPALKNDVVTRVKWTIKTKDGAIHRVLA